MRKKDSEFIRTMKKLEKLDGELGKRFNWSKVIKGKESVPEQCQLIFQTMDEVESIVSEALSEYDKILHNLDVQALVDDE